MPRVRSTAGAMLVTTLVVVGAGSVMVHRFESAPATTTTTSTTSTTTPVPPTTTTTTVPAGELPQTTRLPPAQSRGLTGRMIALLRAAATGDPALGYGAFFPQAAYVQTKSGSGNAEDWHYRLIGHFDQDISADHLALGPGAGSARLLGYSVDDARAVWVLPGVEWNKGPYWRVYDSTLTYAIGTRVGVLTITTMISWRGEWYVVHLNGFNS